MYAARAGLSCGSRKWIAANEVDRAVVAREKGKWPVDLMGGQRLKRPTVTIDPDLRQAILDTEVGQPLVD